MIGFKYKDCSVMHNHDSSSEEEEEGEINRKGFYLLEIDLDSGKISQVELKTNGVL
jgi:hypothetical protein